MKHKNINMECPCGSNKAYNNCCELFHKAEQIPATAELLMRSRYTAYVLELNDYIRATWHTSTYENTIKNNISVKWIGLKIHNTQLEEQSNEAFVEFTARYKINGKAEKMHEISRVVYEGDRWWYIDGVLS